MEILVLSSMPLKTLQTSPHFLVPISVLIILGCYTKNTIVLVY
jgi:hypothetical protein